MTDTIRVRQGEVGARLLDDFEDAENDMGWRSEHTRSLGILLGDFAIIVAAIALGLLVG